MARLFLYDVLFMKNARTHVIVSIYLVTFLNVSQFEQVSSRFLGSNQIIRDTHGGPGPCQCHQMTHGEGV
jgi:hypothetical protein